MTDKLHFGKAQSTLVRMEDILIEEDVRSTEDEADNSHLLSSTVNGMFLRNSYFDAKKHQNTKGYKIVKKGQLVFSPQNIWMGNINVNTEFEYGFVSPSYKVYSFNKQLADPNFMAYYLRMPAMLTKYRLSSEQGASVVRRNLNFSQFYSILLELPQVEAQIKAAAVLNLMDTKIDNEKIEIDRLKVLKRSMLSKLFPKLGYNSPEIRFAGFSESWSKTHWKASVKISNNMVDPKTGNYDDLPHIAPGNIESYSGTIKDVKLVKDENLISGKFLFHEGDIVYSKIRPNLAKYYYAASEGLTSADAYVLNTQNGLSQKFLYGVIQTADFYQYAVAASKRTGMPKINRNQLNQYSFLSPLEFKEQEKIGETIMTIEELYVLHQRQYEKLVDCKKALLHKIIGG